MTFAKPLIRDMLRTHRPLAMATGFECTHKNCAWTTERGPDVENNYKRHLAIEIIISIGTCHGYSPQAENTYRGAGQENALPFLTKMVDIVHLTINEHDFVNTWTSAEGRIHYCDAKNCDWNADGAFDTVNEWHHHIAEVIYTELSKVTL